MCSQSLKSYNRTFVGLKNSVKTADKISILGKCPGGTKKANIIVPPDIVLYSHNRKKSIFTNELVQWTLLSGRHLLVETLPIQCAFIFRIVAGSIVGRYQKPKRILPDLSGKLGCKIRVDDRTRIKRLKR